jgi:hypothetical protein
LSCDNPACGHTSLTCSALTHHRSNLGGRRRRDGVGVDEGARELQLRHLQSVVRHTLLPPLLQRARGVDALASAAGRAGGEGGSIARTLCASCSAAAGGQTEIITYGMRWSLAAKHHHGKCPEGGMQREDACNSRRVVPRPAQPARRLNLHPPVPGPPPARASLHSGPPTPRARARRSCAGCSRSRRPSSLDAIVPRHARHQHRSAWPASVKLRCCC